MLGTISSAMDLSRKSCRFPTDYDAFPPREWAVRLPIHTVRQTPPQHSGPVYEKRPDDRLGKCDLHISQDKLYRASSVDDRKLITEHPGIVPQAENQLLIHVACWLKRLLQMWQRNNIPHADIQACFNVICDKAEGRAYQELCTAKDCELSTAQPKSPRGEPKEAVCITCNSTRKQLSNQFG